MRIGFLQSVLALSAVLLAVIDGNAADPVVRKLTLPKTAYHYTGVVLPRHFTAVMAAHDNTPQNNPITDEGATLGRVLFYDVSLSRNRTVSCASCHRQELAFTDGRKLSIGFDGRHVARNSMSLINVRYHKNGRFFWDERASTLETQVLMPIENDIEMGNTLTAVVAQLQQDPIYPPLFDSAFGSESITAGRMAKALAQFLRAIVSFRSKYDVGRAAVDSVYEAFPNFSPEENHGKELFLGKGRCASCHLMSGETKPSADRQSAFFVLKQRAANGVDGKVEGSDPGVGGHTGQQQELGAFKVSSLRNVTLTGPYMHDGRFATIDRVVEHYSWGVRPHPNLDARLQDHLSNKVTLPERQKLAVIAFLETLVDHALIADRRFSDPFVAATASYGNANE